ncbi:ThuA domain-containing protein [Mariniflexile sp. AS56]|uniref:ThuA domain-containing protein n=1 Tax=Mariniflexile sp. AS56 TaxID=3063957 RepID=UPI0026EEE1EC|nr:ThuA domain-containing protein [Mariniflexile sp. AS56]MDO7172377.1 ThuA domain-containing protein [Mariniflexile sp. AS56]
MKQYLLIIVFTCFGYFGNTQNNRISILNFNGDHGYVHQSKSAGMNLVEKLAKENGWKVVSTGDASIFTSEKLLQFDVIIFNNNCGNKGRILSDNQQMAFQEYIRNDGGFVGIHCAGAIWNEGGEFQLWYEGLIGTKLVDHPKVQSAKLIVENVNHPSTKHLQKEWTVTDEWHRFSFNPRKHVHVLLSVDEDSYEGVQKMGGDHPFTWYQYYDGGRSFFTSLGHTKEIYADPNYQKLIAGGIIWAANRSQIETDLPVQNGLLLDLDADNNVLVEDGDKVSAWGNKIENSIRKFVKQDEGRKIKGSGRPQLKMNVSGLNGHNSIVFHRQELINNHEDAFDHLTTGSGFTWLSVMSVYEQVKGKPGVNSFFGNLRNTNLDKQGQFEGFWGGVNLENHVWMSSRNGLEKGTWNVNSPLLLAKESFKKEVYYLVMGRLGAGEDTVTMELFVNGIKPIVVEPFPVNPNANPSKMAIGQERDATNHPGAESFDGEIARFLIFERPLSDKELKEVSDYLIKRYTINL